MGEEKEPKINFFEKVLISIKDFEIYPFFAMETLGAAIRYLALIILIFAVIVAGAFTYKFGSSVNKGISYFKENLTEITYTNSSLSINSRRGNYNS